MFAIRGNGARCDDRFHERFNTEEEAIDFAKKEFEKKNFELFGYEYNSQKKEITEDLYPLITVMTVSDFKVEDCIDDAVSTTIDIINESYEDFESGIDDGIILFKPGFTEELKKAIEPVVKRMTVATGITSKGTPIYDYNVLTGERM